MLEERQQRLRLGDKGEKVAANFLLAQGYEILNANFANEKGYQWGEIDLIVRSPRGAIVFVEVKTRQNLYSESNENLCPEENITTTKIKKIERAAVLYLKENDLFDVEWRIDAVTVIFNQLTKKISIKQIKYIRI